jgi:hypothetical protein
VEISARDSSAWPHLKRSLVNLVKQDISQLTALVKTRVRADAVHRPGLLEGSLAKPGLDLAPLQEPTIEAR